ncbi:hypothetical protein KCW65_23840, partial [Mycobacterium tuberculosis]|nr:hypothetical protein [Mycobacterium tuberculosis]
MLTTASVTSLRRARGLPRGPLGAVLGVVIGTLVTLGLVLVLGLVDLRFERIIAMSRSPGRPAQTVGRRPVTAALKSLS